MTTQTLSIQVIVGGVILIFSLVALAIISIKNILGAEYPSEKRFLKWSTLGFWAFLFVLLGVMYATQPPWRYIVLGIYFVHLPFMIYRVSIRRQLIREYESRHARSAEASRSNGS